MSIIQDIRDKYAKVAIVLIALSLIGFILTDYIKGRDRQQGGGGANSVGSINGTAIDYNFFNGMVQQTQAYYERSQNMQLSPDMKQNIIEQVWNGQVDRILIENEAKKIGISVGTKERGDIYFGPNAPQDLKSFGTSESGQYDAIRAKKQMEQYLKSDKVTLEAKEQIRRYLAQLEQGRLSEKFYSLFYKSANVPRWMAEKQIADNNLIAKASLVKALYTDSIFRDTTIKVTDKEIEEYISKHKDDFKQPESRSIDFVSFSAAPSASDSAAIKEDIARLKMGFDTTKDVQIFLRDKPGDADYQEIYYPYNQLSPSAKDSIIKLPINGVFGPYEEGNAYMLAKLIEIKTLPDSVKCRHVLISTNESEGGFPDSIAAKKIDSVKKAIEGGAPWGDMVNKYNPATDGSRTSKGEMTFDSYTIQSGMLTGNFAKEFGQFILFDGKPGERKVVKTNFGWHYIEVLSFIKPSPSYKVAYIRKKISASDATESVAHEAAVDFASKVKDAKTFDDEFQKTLKPRGLIKGIGKNISRNAGSATPQIGYSRELVRAIYDAKAGEVLKPIEVGDNWIVAVVTEVLNEGTQSAAAARPALETILRNKKKAEMLKQKIGKVTSLTAAAATLGTPVQVVDSLRMTIGAPQQNLPYDPKVYGAIFNTSNKGKLLSDVLVGEFGIYVVQPENVTAASVETTTVADFRKQQTSTLSNNQLGVLKLKASIKDKRSTIY